MVSVILPTYNRAPFLRECIQSVLQQGIMDLELLILDDGSEDDTKQLVSSIQDDRIRYFQLPHTGYNSRTKNFAIQRSVGDLIAFIDSDDTWKPDKLNKQLRLLADRPEVGFSITDITIIRDSNILKEHTYDQQGTIQYDTIFPKMVQNRFLVYNPTLVLRKNCFEKTGHFNETMRSGEHDLNMRLAYHFKAGIIYEPLLLRRMHGTNWSDEMAFENYQEYLATFSGLYDTGMITKKDLQKARNNAFYKMGRLYAAEDDRGKARGNYFQALKNGLFHAASYRGLIKTWLNMG